MLSFIAYIFAFAGVSMLLISIIIKIKLTFPGTAENKLIAALSSYRIKFQKRWITPNKTQIIALSDTAKKIAIGTLSSGQHSKAKAVLYSFDDIAGCEIVENAFTLTKVTETSRISRIVLKDGNPGTPDDTDAITELVLKIYIKNSETPVYSLSFLPGELVLNKSDARYTQALTEILQIHKAVGEIVAKDNKIISHLNPKGTAGDIIAKKLIQKVSS
jgi:hypothetical protein